MEKWGLDKSDDVATPYTLDCDSASDDDKARSDMESASKTPKSKRNSDVEEHGPTAGKAHTM
jgi:hypothetical protein